jgi:nitrite reductase/ring-hydroxylating ferredoxin subunit
MAFVEVMKLDDLGIGEIRPIEINGEAIALCRMPDGVFALSNQCSHEAECLSDGELDLERRTLECPKHFGEFSVDTGAPVTPPPTEPVRVFDVRVREGYVDIDVP